MARLPRGRITKWKFSLPTELAAKVELTLMDRDRGKPIYGLRSQLLRELLQDWVAAGEPMKESNHE